MLSLNTDFIDDPGNIAHSWKLAVEAGFTHLPWCQEWNTGKLYNENGLRGDWPVIHRLLAEYDHELLALCYDAGHGNFTETDLTGFRWHAHRLLAIHLHDNHGIIDEHRAPGDSTIDWPGLVAVIANSSYDGPLNFEFEMGEENHPELPVEAFLAHVRKTAFWLETQIPSNCHG